MRRFAKILVVVAAAAATLGAGQAPPQRLIEFSKADREALTKVSTYLTQIRSLAGDFTQIGPNGQLDSGKLYILKPGKVRFEYAPPSPLLVVSDGRIISVINTKLGTDDRAFLSDTPLTLLLNDKIDLNRNDAIVRVQHNPGTIVVEARTSKNRNKPNIAITFSESPLELRQWSVIDDQGLTTTVALRNLQPGAAVSEQLFVFKEKPGVGTKRRD
jgi:Outer membrane lipoprotein-sorting protein